MAQCDLETEGRGRSRSLKMAPFDRLYKTLYWSAIVSIAVCCTIFKSLTFFSMRFMSHNWSATKRRLHPHSVAAISRHSVLSGDRIRQCETSSGSRHKDSRHFLQAWQCPCYVRKRFSRDNCCRGRPEPGCRIVGLHTR